MRKDYSEYIGQQFGELIILSISEPIKDKNSERYCVCKCSCGKEKITQFRRVINGRTTSCGHVNREKLVNSLIQNPNCYITNKSTGIRNIWFMKRLGLYRVEVTRNKVAYREHTHSLEEAIKIKERILQDLGELD